MFDAVNATVRIAKAGTGIGVVTHGDKALLVDSGLDENLVRKVVNALANEGVTVAAVANTHAHADHIGGNHWVAKRTGCVIAASEHERVFVEHPEFEPYSLFGAVAPKALTGKFLQARPSTVGHILREGEQEIAGFRVRARPLAGHSLGQMGIEVDGVLFVGDALLPEATLSKYGLVFAVDPAAARESTERLATVRDATIVSYHGGVVHDVAGAVRANADAMRAAEDAVLAFLARGPASSEDVLVELLDRFRPAQLTVELHALQAATVRGYLSALERAGRVEAILDGARALWSLR